MNLNRAKALAEALIKHHCPEYTLAFDNAKRRFGVCRRRNKEISLSKPLILLNNDMEVMDTILHEIAHALTPGHGHDRTFYAKCREIGAKGQRCSTAVAVQGRFVYKCISCGHTRYYHKRLKRICSCSKCSNIFDRRYLMKLTEEKQVANNLLEEGENRL